MSQTQKIARLEATMTEEQKALLVEAAQLTGRSLSDFVVNSSVEAAKRTIEEHQIIQLSQRDQERFVEALLNPPEPAENLKVAAMWYKEVMESHHAVAEEY